ncbi:MAG: hypothetical protein RI907_2763 [Pseudomonadota bacterium]|jgi:hypothetical protein
MPFIGLSHPRGPRPDARLTLGAMAPHEPTGPEPLQLVAFLRHVGCPFAEHTVKRLRHWAEAHPEVGVTVVSHGDADVTQHWLQAIGGLGALRLVIDTDRQTHARWGLGESGLWHFAGPASLRGVVRLWARGIRNRDASGTRWQRAGVFLIEHGRVQWLHVPRSAEGFRLPVLQGSQAVAFVPR